MAWAADAPTEIVFGFFPAGNPQKLTTESLDFAKELQAKLQVPVSIYVAKDYGALTKAFRDKKVDFAFFTPFVFVDLEREKRVKVLLKKVWDTDVYFSSVIVKKTSKFKKMSQLKNARIAFVDQYSTSGFLYPSRELAKLGFKASDFASIQFAGSHKAAVELLDQDKVDAIAVFADDAKSKVSAVHHYGKNGKDYLVLWTSEAIPNDPLCVRNDFYDKYARTTHDVMFALVEMAEENVKTNKWGEVLGARALVPATSRHYDGVRTIIQLPGLDGVKY